MKREMSSLTGHFVAGCVVTLWKGQPCIGLPAFRFSLDVVERDGWDGRHVSGCLSVSTSQDQYEGTRHNLSKIRRRSRVLTYMTIETIPTSAIALPRGSFPASFLVATSARNCSSELAPP